ncbi:MAG TPA: hypothetical protein VMC02_06185 [Steroidobacteraceae bacterium]|nr:hypothetical protein [Steroidobacteraceae bacterium]
MGNANTTPRWMSVILVASLLYSTSARADCVLPAPPSRIPDGRSASAQEMLAAMRTLKRYNDDIDEYTKCLEFEKRQNHISYDDQERQRNAAIDSLQNVANRFNEQVRRFKARGS